MTTVPTLDTQQRWMVETYLGMDQGLAVLGSVPGAGKSTVIGKAVATDLLDRAAAGDERPHERVIVASFSKEDAADIVPDVVAWITELVERGAAPDGLEQADVDRLITQVREAPRIGTVDSVLRTVFGDVATTMGFDGMPTVGNAALVEQLHRDAFEAVTREAEGERLADRVKEAYADSADEPSVSGLCRRALEITRQRNWSPDEFRVELRAAVTANYRGGAPTSIDDVFEAVAAYRDEQTASELRETLDDSDADALVAADRTIHDEWLALVETFADLFAMYVTEYDARSRERGVVSHTDCAALVDEYFRAEEYASPRRDRLRRRYREGIDSVVIDEAQDVSQLQHDALSHLVADNARVLLAGDLDQCIYQWRDATPDLFEQALADGRYFGRTWTPHETVTADQNYRSRPSIVRFANAVADRGLGHDERGGLGDVTTEPPSLSANREQSSGPAVHVAAFTPVGTPGHDNWVDPEHGGREAAVLAQYVAGALEAGRFSTLATQTEEDEETVRPGITVLFSRRRFMDVYAAAFEDRGLTVANASAYLFAAPAVRAVIDVIDWLIDPTSATRTRELVKHSTLAAFDGEHTDAGPGLAAVAAAFAAHDYAVQDVHATDAVEAPHTSVLAGLASLIDDARSLRAAPASVLVRTVIDRLGLETDSLGIDPETDPSQRVVTLDAFIELIEEWEGDDRYSPTQLCGLLDPFVQSPRSGPTQPVAESDAVDVVFRTVHDMKGDQDDVVILADTARRQGSHANYRTSLVASGSGVALAPPADAVDPETPRLPGVGGGLYTPDPGGKRDGPGNTGGLGLRWAAEHWVRSAGDSTTVRGPPVRRDAAVAARAEAWRTLHVALTRARDHLVMPLPRTTTRLSGRDHWAQVLCEVLGANVLAESGTCRVSLPDGDGIDRDTRVVINDVGLDARIEGADGAGVVPPQPSMQAPPTDIASAAWQPRFVRPSLLAPLVDDPERALVPLVRDQSVDTETKKVDPTLPLTFETVSSEVVGDIVHTLVAHLVRAELPAAALRGANARAIAVEVCDQFVDVGDAERAGLVRFLVDRVLPQLATSDLWACVEAADAVYTDEPLHAVTRVAGVDVEIQGEADLVVVDGDTYVIEDLKTALAEPTAARRRQYRLQVRAYAWVLSQQVDSDVRVVPRVTTVGAVAETYGEEAFSDTGVLDSVFSDA